MKVPQLLLQYLLEHHAFRLEGLGTIRLDAPPAGFLSEKGEISIPAGAITFEADIHATADEDLISHIVQHTAKMRSLAASDMESFTENGKQLLNISKPFVLEQIGVLQKDAHGGVHFTQGEIVLDKEEQPRKKGKNGEGEDGIHFDDNYRKPSPRAGGKPQIAGIILLVIAGTALLGWVSWFFYNRSVQASADQLELQSPPALEVKETNPERTVEKVADTSAVVKDTTETRQPIVVSPVQSLADFKVVVLVASKDKAQRRYDSLVKWGHNVVMLPVDSNLYQLAIPIHAPLSDSTRHKDSLGRFFGRRVWIETK